MRTYFSQDRPLDLTKTTRSIRFATPLPLHLEDYKPEVTFDVSGIRYETLSSKCGRRPKTKAFLEGNLNMLSSMVGQEYESKYFEMDVVVDEAVAIQKCGEVSSVHVVKETKITKRSRTYIER